MRRIILAGIACSSLLGCAVPPPEPTLTERRLTFLQLMCSNGDGASCMAVGPQYQLVLYERQQQAAINTQNTAVASALLGIALGAAIAPHGGGHFHHR